MSGCSVPVDFWKKGFNTTYTWALSHRGLLVLRAAFPVKIPMV
jgi:hypothetical protein